MATLTSTILGHLIEHVLEFIVFLFNLALIEVLDRISWSTELDQDN